MNDRSKPESLRLRTVTPSLTVNDIHASLAWYRDVLGFTVGEEFHREGALVAVSLKAGTSEFFLGQDDFAKGRDRKKGEGFRLYCATVQDVDKLAAEIKGRGGALAQEPTDQPWGTREIAVVDPDGFKISIARRRDEQG
jgi:uncharacterized glyoxalase superfamily protein PhnB